MKGEKQNMNKLFTKIAKIFLGLSMAAGVGVAIGAGRKDASPVHATDYNFLSSIPSDWTASMNNTTTESTDRGVGWGAAKGTITLTLTNSNTVSSVVITASTNNTGNTLAVAVGGTNYGSAQSIASGASNKNKDYTFSGSSSGNVVVTISDSAKTVWIKAISVTTGSASFTVTYNANNATTGSVPTDGTSYTSGSTVTVKGNTGNLERTDYEFGGWNTKADGSGTTYAGGATFTISENTILYAKWGLASSGDGDVITASDLNATGSSYVSFSVAKTATYIGYSAKSGSNMQFNSNGTPTNRCIATSVSGGFIRSVSVTYGNANSKTLTVLTSHSAYSISSSFNSGTSQGTLSSSNAKVTISGDWEYVALFPSGATYPASLTFEWEEPTTYSVTYNANNATSGSVPTDGTSYTSGSTVTVKGNTGNLARTGYDFAGWNTKADGSGTTYAAGSGTFSISDDTTLYAKWTLKSYLITWKNWDGSTLSSGNVNHGVTPTYSGTPTRPADAQYTYSFTGWSPTVVAATAAATYTAQYSSTIRSYSVGGGTITNGSITSTTANYGTSATVTITPDSGYRLPGSLGTVTVNGVAYAGAQYNSSNGQVTIPSVEGTVVINAECPVDAGTEYSIETHLTGCTTNAPASMYDNDIIEITISVSAHYKLPDTVTVSGGVDVQYTKADGTIIIDGADDDVDITITCIPLVMNDISVTLGEHVSADANNPTQVEEGEEVELYFTADEGYFLSEDISVSGLVEDFEWDETEGLLYFVGESAQNTDVEIEVTAIKKALSSITISPTSGNHTLGTAFTKPAVTAHYNDGSESVVTNAASFSSSAYDDGMFITAGNQTVTISYTEDGVTKTYPYTATVSERSISTITTYNLVTASKDNWAGEYVIMSDDASFTYTLGIGDNNGRVANGDSTPTVTDNVISTVSANQTWTISKNGDYYNIKNNGTGSEGGEGKYLVATTAKNKAEFGTDKDDDHALWSISYANSKFEIINKGRASDSDTPANKYLRNNTGSGWAAYSSTQANGPALFEKVETPTGTRMLIQLTATGPAADTKLEGDTLTADSFSATAHFDTGAEQSVTPVIEEGPSTLVVGNNTFVLSYTENNVKKQCTVVVVAAENTAELDGIVWSQEGVSRTIFEGSAIGSFGTLQEHFDNDTTLNLDVANCTVAVYNNTSGSKAHDIANVASYTWNLSNDNGKYLGVTYEGYTKYSGVINVVETIEDVVGKVETMTFTTKASESNPIAVGETVVFTYDEENMELTGINNSIGVASSFSTNPGGTFPLTVVSGNTSGSVAFKNGSDYLKSISDNKLTTETSITDASSWTISYEDDVVTITNVSTEREIHYNTSSGQSRFCAYLSTNSFPCIQVYKGVSQWVPGSGPSIANTNAVAQKVVLEFAEHFNDVMECVSGGTTTNVSGKWDVLAEDFDNWFANGDKDLEGDDLNHAYALFAGADAVEGGDTLQDMLARYEYICAKYKLDDFLNDVTDRPPVAKSPAVNPLSFIVNGNNTNTVAIIVIISMVSVTAIGGYFFLRKRKENN